MAEKNNQQLKKLDRIVYLLEHLLAIQLLKTGLTWTEIAKHMIADKAKINKMLKGIKKDKKYE